MAHEILVSPNGLKAHLFTRTGEAYDACQCNDEINTGDVIVVTAERVVGFADTWPFAITDESGNLHSVNRQATTPSGHAYSRGITAEQVAHAYHIKSIAEQFEHWGDPDADVIEGEAA